jgi:hypothetical protein
MVWHGICCAAFLGPVATLGEGSRQRFWSGGRTSRAGGVVRVEKLERSPGPACCSVQELVCANSPGFNLHAHSTLSVISSSTESTTCHRGLLSKKLHCRGANVIAPETTWSGSNDYRGVRTMLGARQRSAGN